MLKSGTSKSPVEHSTTKQTVRDGLIDEFGYFHIGNNEYLGNHPYLNDHTCKDQTKRINVKGNWLVNLGQNQTFVSIFTVPNRWLLRFIHATNGTLKQYII